MNIVTFDFNSLHIRTIVEDGVIWFVGNDLASALGYSSGRDAIANHVSEGDVAVRSVIDRLNRPQDSKVINESGMYSLIINSRLPTAKVFKHWVTSEVLPSIRKTGKYAVPAASIVPAYSGLSAADKQVALDHATVELGFWRLCKVPEHLAFTEVSKSIQLNHKFDMTPMLEMSPIMDHIPNQELAIEPTELGELYGISAKDMNLLLARHKLQTKPGDWWVPTTQGESMCVKHAWKKGNKSGYNLKWIVASVKSVIPCPPKLTDLFYF